MSEDKVLTVKVEFKVAIDRELIESAGLDAGEVKDYVELRLRSLAYRLSAWLTETISSSILLSTRARPRQAPPTSQGKRLVARIKVGRDGNLYFEPVAGWTKNALERRKYVVMGGKRLVLSLTRSRRIREPEASILREYMRGAKILRLAGRMEGKRVILEVEGVEGEGGGRP